jgi:hypothetical protein
MKIELMSMLVLGFLLEDKGIFFMSLGYSYIFKDKITIKLSDLTERLWILIPWMIMLLYMKTSLMDIILFLTWVIIRELIIIKNKYE